MRNDQIWLHRSILLILMLLIAGCATNADRFVEAANDPQLIDMRFCVAAAPETVDGSTPPQGYQVMNCGNNLQALKVSIISYCSKDTKSKCMATWYFERGKDLYIQSFERENIARIRAQNLAKNRERLALICDGYGFKRGTSDHSNCMMKQAQNEKEDQQRQVIADQIEWQRRVNLMNSASEQLRNNGQQPGSKICTPQSNGTMYCQ